MKISILLVILMLLLTSCDEGVIIIDKNNDYQTQKYEGINYLTPDVYEQIGNNITLNKGDYNIFFSASINSSSLKNYYFTILKNGSIHSLCNRLIGGTGKPIIVAMNCNLTIVNNENVSLGVMIK